jgi:hypothetical protein
MTIFFGGALALALAADEPKKQPPPPDPAKLKEVRSRLNQLDMTLGILVRQGARDPYLADIEI